MPGVDDTGWEDRIVFAFLADGLAGRQVNSHINKDKNCDKCYHGKVQNTMREYLNHRNLIFEI